MFAWIFRTFSTEMAVFFGGEEQNTGRGGTMLTPKELVLTIVACYHCATFDENRSRNATLECGQTDRQTDTRIDTN